MFCEFLQSQTYLTQWEHPRMNLSLIKLAPQPPENSTEYGNWPTAASDPSWSLPLLCELTRWKMAIKRNKTCDRFNMLNKIWEIWAKSESLCYLSSQDKSSRVNEWTNKITDVVEIFLKKLSVWQENLFWEKSIVWYIWLRVEFSLWKQNKRVVDEILFLACKTASLYSCDSKFKSWQESWSLCPLRKQVQISNTWKSHENAVDE